MLTNNIVSVTEARSRCLDCFSRVVRRFLCLSSIQFAPIRCLICLLCITQNTTPSNQLLYYIYLEMNLSDVKYLYFLFSQQLKLEDILA